MQERQLVSGWVMLKWSCSQRSGMPPSASSLSRMSVSSVFGSAGAASAMSMQAWSMATGSKLANMPRSGTMGVSFSAWQSQLGLMSMASEIWKLGRSCTTACVYSAILQFSTSTAWS